MRADDLHVEVRQAAGHRQRQLDHALHRHRASVQVVKQGPLLVVLRDQPELSPRPVIYPEEARLFRFMKKMSQEKPSPTRGRLRHANEGVCCQPRREGPGTAPGFRAGFRMGAGAAEAIPRHDPQHTLVISGDKAQDVFVPQHNRLINFCLPKPGPLVSGGEDFHSYIFSAPFSTPDFAKSAFPYDFLQDDSPCDRPLYEQRQTWFKKQRQIFEIVHR